MYNNDSNSLNAGAPDIRLSGNQQMASANNPMADANDIALEMFGKPYHQLTPPELELFDLEMERLMQKVSAPQQNSGIMAAAPTGTYTQRRKQMMAGGGIAGLKQIGKPGGLVEPGISKYGALDFITDPIKSAYDKFVDDIIPNEIKENPLLTAALVGGGINQFGIPFTEGMGQNWLGDLLGKIPGVPDDLNLVLGDDIGFTGGISSGDLDINNPNEMKNVGNPLLDALIKTGQTIMPGGETGYFDLYNNSLTSPYLGEGEGRRVNPLYPLGIGAAVGKYVEGLPKDELPMDTTSIDPAAIATAARGTDAEGAAAGLRFLPEQVTRAAQGGRMGYAGGERVGPSETEKGLLALIRKLMMQKEGERVEPEIRFGEVMPPRYLPEWAKPAPMPEKGPPKDWPGDSGIYRDPGNFRKRLRERFFPEEEMTMAAQGGRIGADEGGLMNLGGMEKDYREEGGFVPIGGEEKADDVPARLSKNEFVFTADAVRGAGGGDIDKGAEIMEDLMNNLEGARGMFANAQKLQNRII